MTALVWSRVPGWIRVVRYWIFGFLGIAAATAILALSAGAETLRVTGPNGRALLLAVSRIEGVDRVNVTEVARALGARVVYDPGTRQVTFALADRRAVLLVGSVRVSIQKDGMEPVLGRLARPAVRFRGSTWIDEAAVTGFLRQVREARFRPAGGSPASPPFSRATGESTPPGASAVPPASAPVAEGRLSAEGSVSSERGAPEAARPGAFIRNIVIDAGHGDQDAGAIGPGGTREKDVNLAVALRLERALRERTSARITMTRRDDTFLSLRERVAVARRVKADLFVSIHANSSAARNRHTLSGTEVYFFSSPSDEDARLAERMEGGPFDPAAEGIDPVLWDLMLAGNVVESHRLADIVMRELPRHTGLPSRGVKSARFYVMYYGVISNFPSILIELGFMSNPNEEAKLSSPAWQDRAAEGIAIAIESYLADLERRYPGGRGWSR